MHGPADLRRCRFQVRYYAMSTRSTVIIIRMMEAQVRTRRNAQEARYYLADLLKWQEEQKEKDEYLRREATVSKKEPDTGSNASKDQCIRPEASRYNNKLP